MTSSCVQSQIQKYTDIDIDKDEYKDPKYGVNIFNVDDVEVGARVNHLCSCKLAASGGTRIHKHTQIHKNMQNILKDSNRHYSSYFVVPRGRLWSRIWRMKFFRMDAIFLDLFCTCYEVDIVLLWRVSFAKFGLKDKVYCKVLWLFIYNVWSIWFFCLQIFLTIDPLFGHEKKHHNKQSSTFFGGEGVLAIGGCFGTLILLRCLGTWCFESGDSLAAGGGHCTLNIRIRRLATSHHTNIIIFIIKTSVIWK